jgi:hypothetical protein
MNLRTWMEKSVFGSMIRHEDKYSLLWTLNTGILNIIQSVFLPECMLSRTSIFLDYGLNLSLPLAYGF